MDPQLANFLLAANQGDGNQSAPLQPDGNVLSQLLQQRHEQQARLELMRQVEAEMALRGLAPASSGDLTQGSDQHALLLSLLTGQSSASGEAPPGQPPAGTRK